MRSRYRDAVPAETTDASSRGEANCYCRITRARRNDDQASDTQGYQNGIGRDTRPREPPSREVTHQRTHDPGEETDRPDDDAGHPDADRNADLRVCY